MGVEPSAFRLRLRLRRHHLRFCCSRLLRRHPGLAQQPAKAPEQEEPEERQERRHEAPGDDQPSLVLVVALEEGNARTKADSEEKAEEHAQKVIGLGGGGFGLDGSGLSRLFSHRSLAPTPRDEPGAHEQQQHDGGLHVAQQRLEHRVG